MLLLVLGASAALSLFAVLLLSVALGAHESSVYRQQRAQARELAEAALRQLHGALEAGIVAPPPPGVVLKVLNGVSSAGVPVPLARFPVPAGRPWPELTSQPPAAGSALLGFGASLEVRAVIGPLGDLRGLRIPAAGGRLYEARGHAWFGRSQARARARFLVQDGAVRRLN